MSFPVRWTASTRTDQGPRRHMADAAHDFGRLAWAVTDGIGDDYEPAYAATMAAETAPYAAVTGGAAYGITAARAALQDEYEGAPRGQEGDCVMVTAVPMAERIGGGWEVTRSVLRDEPIASVRVLGPVELVMLCTDGVSKALTTQDIAHILTADIRPRHMTRALIAAARARQKGTDNIAVTVIAPRAPHPVSRRRGAAPPAGPGGNPDRQPNPPARKEPRP